MTKKKIAIVVVLLLLICGISIFFLVRCQKGPQEDGDDDPVDVDPKDNIVSESDIDVGEYEDFDWESEAGEAVKKDDSFSQKPNSSSQSQGGNTSTKDDNGVGLIHDESQNEGIEVEFDSWDKQ